MSLITIDVENLSKIKNFIISGEISMLLKNKRIKLSLKRLGYSVIEDKILIPFQDKTQIKTLQEIQRLLSKFDIEQDLSENIKSELESFNREENLFEKFSEKAMSIRNDKFKDNPELVALFNQFQNVLKEELERRLYPLQLLSAFHMAFAQNSCNFAVPGAGKTSIVYGAYAYLKNLPIEHPSRVDKLLVIGPISSFAPWEKEYKACFGYSTKSFRMSGNSEISREQKEQHLYSATPAELTLIFHGGVDSYESDIIDFLKRNKTMVVVDEAHRIKNPEGVWGRSVTEISKEAISRVILTGTPVPNGYQDIFNLYKFIYPFKFKEILNFHYHNLEDMTYNSQPESSRVQELKENISPYFIRIKKDDLNLPGIEEHVMSIEMDSYQREIYDFIESQYIENFKENDSATVKDILNKAKLIRLRQASTNPSLLSKTLKDSLENGILTGEVDPNSIFTTDTDEFINDSEFFNKICKYSELETPKKFVQILNLLMAEILPENGKVIIWTIFIQNAKELKHYLKLNNIKSNLLIGEISQPDREATIDKFNDPNNLEFQVVIANPFSVAESISLHKGCHNAIYLERDYNCSNFLQSKDRIHRVGLDKSQITKYYYFISKDSIDEVINHRLLLKIARMEEIINDDIPLFSRINDNDETDIIKELIANYAQRT
ncbi:DEAD/DEAH box helicase [Tenacibaculum aquimarinum]|uniref:DEAD/DEAH box helicase n=1 Tax=Tenacibaculum aquimarinum TaxID=2910675 RepID=UPI001F0AC592|nr:DEAD/DEAH box helicase [Tenacibaculum aquimarinum]MCH3881605.1 DEAD/DEAH box helicase [Tenacibaculum aquimarinum]